MTRFADPPSSDEQGANRPTGGVAASYAAAAGRTWPARIAERGGLRLRHPRGPACEAVLVNTAGGIVSGDRLAIALRLEPGAAVTATSAAAEKVYRSDGREAAVAVSGELAGGTRLGWLPQETILFDGARLRRCFDFDLAGDAVLLAAEITVFGRLASGERATSGSLRDCWRVRREGRLVYADALLAEGRLGALLDRPAVAAGGRAVASVLFAAADAASALDGVREACDQQRDKVLDAGASLREGMIVARLVARRLEGLRSTVAAVVDAVGAVRMPRSWF